MVVGVQKRDLIASVKKEELFHYLHFILFVADKL
jgi:hypothetical protein